MATLTSTTRKSEGIPFRDAQFDDRTLKAAGAEVWPAGAVLARDVADGTYVRYDPAGGGGINVASAVLTYEVEFTEAGEKSERPLIGGRIRIRDLVDVNGTSIEPASEAVFQLRDHGVNAYDTHQNTY